MTTLYLISEVLGRRVHKATCFTNRFLSGGGHGYKEKRTRKVGRRRRRKEGKRRRQRRRTVI